MSTIKIYSVLYWEEPNGHEPTALYYVEAENEDEVAVIVSQVEGKPVTVHELEIDECTPDYVERLKQDGRNPIHRR